MRIMSIVLAVVVSTFLFFLVFEREKLLAFAGVATPDATEEAEAAPTERSVSVVVMPSTEQAIDSAVLIRGRTEAARQVEVRAETSGVIVSAPLRKGSKVSAGQLMCEIDPATREISLAEAIARLSEAQARLPEAQARLGEAIAALPATRARIAEAQANVPAALAQLDQARAGVPASDARLDEARARVPEAEARIQEALARVPEAKARLAEAEARVPEAEARLLEARTGVPAALASQAEAEARVPEAEARMAEAAARVKEADINLTAAEKLSKGGFASQTRVASAQAAKEAALAQVQTALSNFKAAQAGVEAAKSRVQGARAGIQSAKSQVEAARAGVEAAKSQVQNAAAGVQTARSQAQNATAGIKTAESQIEGAIASVKSAQSSIEGAEASVISATSQLEGTEASIQSAKSGVESARSGIQAAEAAVAAAREEINRLSVTAPFSGLLESDTAELGTLMQAGALCATIIQLDTIKLVGFVPETEVDKIALGVPAGARLATGREVLGKVTFLSRSADPLTRTFRVEVSVANDDLSIRDGQTVEISVATDGQSAHLVPSSALTLNDKGELGVRTVEDSRARFYPVEILSDTVNGVWLAGLKEQANVIVVGQEYVVDGVLVDTTVREATR